MKKLSGYLLWAFGIAPLLAVILSKSGLRQIGWGLHIKGKVRWIFAAWFAPAVLGALGAAVYFLLVPEALDTGFSYLRASMGEEIIGQLESSGISLPMYAVISCISALTYGPLFNMLLAVGEEAGWRGVMYPALKEQLGVVRGRLVGGVIWGVWHWPIMLLAGYEYGTEYWGAPVTGPLLFCVIAAAMGILLDYFYEKTGTIWAPALCHGAINAFAGVPMMFLKPAYMDRLLLGPLMVGLIGGLPLILTAAVICVRKGSRAEKAA